VYEAASHLPGLEFIVAVSGVSGQETTLNNLRLITKNGLFTQREKSALYARSYCVLFPAYDEDYGLVPVEAMSAGKPCLVCSDGGAAAETVIHNRTGLVVEPTAESVVNGIRTLVQTGQHMSKACIERAKHFSWQAYVTQMENEIRAILSASDSQCEQKQLLRASERVSK
jgi:glycosyltransferase involved in cell wall biosynthesis